MFFEWFIAKKWLSGNDAKVSISAPIIKMGIAAVAIGMTVMLIAVATGVGLQKKIREKIMDFNGAVQITHFDNNQSKVSLNPIDKNQDFYPLPKSIPGIHHIEAVTNKAGIIRTETTFEGVVVKGVGADFDTLRMKKYLISGHMPNFSGNLNAEVLISKYLASRLTLKTGDKFNTYFLKDENDQTPNLRVFEVTGIYDSGFQEFDETYLFADIRHVQRINKWESNQVGHFEVFINDFNRMQEIGNQLYLQTPSSLNVQTTADAYFSIFEWLKLFDFNIALVLGIMILVAGINMITALLVLILERTPTIGLFKALGSSNGSIRGIFLINAAYLIGLGLLLGNVLGGILIGLQARYGFVKLDPENYYVNQAPVFLSFTHWLALNIGTLLLCLLMLLLPTYLVTRVQPVKAIRFN